MTSKFNFQNKTFRIPFLLFWLSISSIYSLIFTTIEFYDNPFSGVIGFVTLLMQWGIVAFTTSGLFCLIAINRFVFAVMFPLIVTASCILSYYKLTVGISLTPMVIELAVVNDMNTWASVISLNLVVLIILSLIASYYVVRFRFKHVSIKYAWIFLITGIVIILTPTVFIKRANAAVINRMPFSFYYSIKDYCNNRTIINEFRNTFDNTTVSAQTNSPDVVVILGESLRSDHISINGYHRNTFPLLSREAGIVSLPDMYTEEWCTHTSIPRIMTRADSQDPDKAYEEQSFITLFKKAGYRTSWISNQDSNPAYVYFMHEADTLIMGNATKSLYNFGKWLDADLLPAIQETFRDNTQKQLMVIHSIGSHWWYRSHYPDSLAKYKPEIDSRVLSDLTEQQLVNSYDNTIIATDNFIHSIISMLNNRNALLIFISDHGEALGENGNYLHAEDYPDLHNPACFVWYSQSYQKVFPDKISSLQQSASKEWSTDAIFHSVIDGAAIEFDGLNHSQSFFSQH